MPLTWTIDSQTRTVEIVAEGDVTFDEALAYFNALEQSPALPYKKLIDGVRGRAAMSGEELMAVVARIREQHALSVMGALAVVASREQAHELARLLGAAAVADRPLKVFDDLKPARRWLRAQWSRTA